MKSFLLIGLGRFGKHMAAKLVSSGNDVMAVEKDENTANAAASFIRNIEIGDSTDEEYIKSLGVDNFDICMVAIGDDFQAALETIVLLKDNGAKYIAARAKQDVHKKLLLRNGADYVVYAERDMAERLAVRFGENNILDYIELGDDYAIYEIGVPNGWVGKSILEESVRTRYNVNILAIKANGQTFPSPDPQHIFEKSETLLIMGSQKDIKPLLK